MDSVILRLLSDEIGGGLSSTVEGVRGFSPMSFAIGVASKGNAPGPGLGSALVVCLDPSLPMIFPLGTSSALAPALKELECGVPATVLPEGFIQSMHDNLHGSTVIRLVQHDSDRVARIEFSTKKGPPLELWLELFGRRPSAILVRSADRVIEACSREGTTTSSGVLLRTGAKYEPPGQRNKLSGDETASDETARDRLKESLRDMKLDAPGEELEPRLSRSIKGLSPHAAKAVLEQVSEAGPVSLEGLLDLVGRSLHDPSRYFVPAVKISKGLQAAPPELFPVRAAGAPQLGKPQLGRDDSLPSLKLFPTASKAAEFAFLEFCRWRRTLAAQRFRKNAEVLSEKLSKLRRHLEQEVAISDRAHDFRTAGELILANLRNIERGAASVELENIHGDGLSSVLIELDPSISLSGNAERYFKKARKAERARTLLKKRIGQVQSSVEEVERFRAGVPDEVREAEAERLARELERLRVQARFEERRRARAPAGQTLSHQPKSAAAQTGREREGTVPGTRQGFNPRAFETSEGFTLIVGRNNKENDFVTHHLAKPEDLWFHASGMPGSHVILKKKGKSEPTRRAIEEAASVAAYFSKGRTSSAVPIIYTEKKYVHKPRGAKPGTASCAREKFLMVRPRRPAPRPL